MVMAGMSIASHELFPKPSSSAPCGDMATTACTRSSRKDCGFALGSPAVAPATSSAVPAPIECPPTPIRFRSILPRRAGDLLLDEVKRRDDKAHVGGSLLLRVERLLNVLSTRNAVGV